MTAQNGPRDYSKPVIQLSRMDYLDGVAGERGLSQDEDVDVWGCWILCFGSIRTVDLRQPESEGATKGKKAGQWLYVVHHLRLTVIV